MSLVKSFFTISGLTFISRILGFIRDILVASILGAGPLAEAFLVAFKLPNFFRRLFAEGAFNAAFVPLFSGIIATDGKEKARKFAQDIFSFLFFVLLIFTILIEIFMPFVMKGLAPGFVSDPNKFELAVYLTRATFPYLLFISLVSLLAGVMNGMNRFAAGAAAPIILNLSLIGAILFLTDVSKTAAHALSYGVAIAGVLQFFWMLAACKREGMSFSIKLPKLNKKVKLFLSKMLPGIFGAGVVQINLWVDIIIGTFIPGAIAFLYYADRVNQLPLSLIGTAMGVALLPMLSRQIKEKRIEDSIISQNRALELVLLLTLPATAAFIAIPDVIISALFERGAFEEKDSLATAYGLVAYAIGLPAFVMVKIFSSSFFAYGDTKTPVKIAGVCMVANVIMNIGFVILLMEMDKMPHVGLAVATSISSWLNLTLLVSILIKKKKFELQKRTKEIISKVILSTFVMVFVLWIVKDTQGENFTSSEFDRISFLIILMVLGKISYFTCTHLTGALKLGELKRFIGKKR